MDFLPTDHPHKRIFWWIMIVPIIIFLMFVSYAWYIFQPGQIILGTWASDKRITFNQDGTAAEGNMENTKATYKIIHGHDLEIKTTLNQNVSTTLVTNFKMTISNDRLALTQITDSKYKYTKIYHKFKDQSFQYTLRGIIEANYELYLGSFCRTHSNFCNVLPSIKTD